MCRRPYNMSEKVYCATRLLLSRSVQYRHDKAVPRCFARPSLPCRAAGVKKTGNAKKDSNVFGGTPPTFFAQQGSAVESKGSFDQKNRPLHGRGGICRGRTRLSRPTATVVGYPGGRGRRRPRAGTVQGARALGRDKQNQSSGIALARPGVCKRARAGALVLSRAFYVAKARQKVVGQKDHARIFKTVRPKPLR